MKTRQKKNPDGLARILVGVDASENAARAAAWAADLAEELGARLTVAHALDLPAADPGAKPTQPTYFSERRQREGDRVLARTNARLAKRHPDLPISAELSKLDPAQALVGFAAEADLLVTGTRGHGGFTGMLLGSVTNKLAAHAPCPVVVIGVDPPEATRSELVLGVEADQGPAPIDFAFRCADLLGLSVHAVRALEPLIAYGGYDEQIRPAVAEEVEALLKATRARHPKVAVTVEPWQGAPVPALIQAAHGARLIVVGSHRRRGPLSFGPGHIVHGLLSHCGTPVAVVPIP